MEKIIKPETQIISSISKLAPKPLQAYYLEAKNGGYQVHRLIVEEGVIIEDQLVESPDGWSEVIGYLDKELSHQFE